VTFPFTLEGFEMAPHFTSRSRRVRFRSGSSTPENLVSGVFVISACSLPDDIMFLCGNCLQCHRVLKHTFIDHFYIHPSLVLATHTLLIHSQSWNTLAQSISVYITAKECRNLECRLCVGQPVSLLNWNVLK
jgi:hypothetical protein